MALTRKQVVARLEAMKRELNFLLADLRLDDDSPNREVRAYDLPPEDSEAVAHLHGLDLYDHDQGQIPEWVIARYGHLWNQQEGTP